METKENTLEECLVIMPTDKVSGELIDSIYAAMDIYASKKVREALEALIPDIKETSDKCQWSSPIIRDKIVEILTSKLKEYEG
jgi:hypothetical protein